VNILDLLGRKSLLFTKDVENLEDELSDIISSNRFLIIGGAGSIGQAVSKEIFKRNPNILHVVDINENNLVELVRDLRSTIGYIDGEFKTYAIDCGSREFVNLINDNETYDYVFNLSALKHVRSEKDPYTLMRMIEVNILNTIKTVRMARDSGVKKYFCVSTDKAANPVNMMGASKRIMEMFLMRESESISISMARFANVAFSDGSLLHSFNQRFAKRQPIAAPSDIKRYFITPQESGELCMLSGLLGNNRDIFFPKMNKNLDLKTFSSIAESYILEMGYTPVHCASEQEARDSAHDLINKKQWPCYFFNSDTTGEKDFEEFYTDLEELDMNSFNGIGIIKNHGKYNNENLDIFLNRIDKIKKLDSWNKKEIIDTFLNMLPEFSHKETGKYLDDKM